MNRKGAILIIVLIMMVALVTGVMVVEKWASRNFSYSQDVYVDNQAAFYFHSAIEVAIRLLENDKNKYDSKRDTWANLPPFRINKDTIVSLKIYPLNAKINVNYIVSKNKQVALRIRRAVEAIFDDYGFDGMEDLKRLLAWELYKGSSELTYYSDLGYHPTGGEFFSLKEVDFVEGLKSFSARFHNLFTVDSASAKININFAPKEVLETYLPEIEDCVGDIIKYRQKKPFENITQLRNVSCVSDDDYLKIQPFITTNSEMFGISVEVTIGNQHRYASALVERRFNRARLVKYFEGKGFYE